jgi:hypothetical protein
LRASDFAGAPAEPERNQPLDRTDLPVGPISRVVSSLVMAGLDPAIYVFVAKAKSKTWITGSSPVMTLNVLQPKRELRNPHERMR